MKLRLLLSLAALSLFAVAVAVAARADDCIDPPLTGWTTACGSVVEMLPHILSYRTEMGCQVVFCAHNVDYGVAVDRDSYVDQQSGQCTTIDYPATVTWHVVNQDDGPAYAYDLPGAIAYWVPPRTGGFRVTATFADTALPGSAHYDAPYEDPGFLVGVYPRTQTPPLWYPPYTRSTDGDPVDLSNGAEDYVAPVDMIAFNPTGPDAVYQRSYHSNLSRPSSVGLPEGWVDNYEAKIVPISYQSVRWTEFGPHYVTTVFAYYLVYPNGAVDTIIGDTLSAPPGAPYAVSIDTGGSIRIKWKGATAWVFDFDGGSADQSYLLSHVIDGSGHAIDIIRNTDANGSTNGRIDSIQNGATHTELLHFVYGGQSGYPFALSRIADSTGRWVDYRIDGAGGYNVSEISSSALRWQYDTTPFGSSTLLTHISEPGPTSAGTVDTYIDYDVASGRVSATRDGKHNQRSYNYAASYLPSGGATTLYGTRVDVSKGVHDGNGSWSYEVQRSWLQLFDPQTRFATGRYDSGRLTKIEYGVHPYDQMYPVRVTDEDGRITEYAYDTTGRGDLVSAKVPSTTDLGIPTSTVTTWNYYYSSFPYLQEIEENCGDIVPGGAHKSPTRLFYNSGGLLTDICTPVPGTVHASGFSTTSFGYTNGFLGAVNPPINAGPNAPTVTLSYTTDGTGNVTSKRPNSISVRTVAAGNGQPIVVALQWNADGTLRSVLDAQGAEVDYSHYADGAIKDVINKWATGPDVSKTTFTYDHQGGRLIDAQAYGYQGGVQTPLAHIVRNYDDAGADSGASGDTEPHSIDRDALGRITSLTDGNSNPTLFGYVSGLLTPETDVATTATTAFPGAIGSTPPYDTFGATDYHDVQNGDPSSAINRTVEVTNGNGVKRTYLYAGRYGELTDVVYADTLNPSHDVTANNLHYTYDLYDRVLTVRHGASDSVYQDKSQYSYDDLGNVKQEDTFYNSGSISETISYGFYANGRRASMTTPAGTFHYYYNLAGQLTGMTSPTAGSIAWGYLNNGLVSWQTSNGGYYGTAYGYDARGLVNQIYNSSDNLNLYANFTGITRDALGNITGLTASIGTGGQAPPPPPLSRTGSGGMSTLSLPPGPPPSSPYSGTTSFVYAQNTSDTNDLCTAYGPLRSEVSTRCSGYTNTFAYDHAFNATRIRGTGGQTYDLDNRRTGTGFVYDGNGNPTKFGHGGWPDQVYDVQDRLVSYPTLNGTVTCAYNATGLRSRKSQNGVDTYFIYDGLAPVVEVNSAGTVTAVNTFGATGLVSRWSTTNGAIFYQFDPSGNVAMYATSAGAGTPTLIDSYGAQTGTPPTGDPFGFQAQWGGYTDNRQGFVLLGHRYYDPATVRWVTRDPIGYSGGINLYAYCGNNPVNLADPSGLCSDPENQATSTDPLIKNLTDDVDWWIDHARNAAGDANIAIQQTNCILDTVGGMGANAMGGGGGGAGESGGGGGAGESGGGGAGGAGAEADTYPSGSFSVRDWTGYPDGVPKPSGPFRVLEGDEYNSARAAANSANRSIRAGDPETYAGTNIHEIQPVKLGGNPTDPANKVLLDPSLHWRATAWWNAFLRNMTNG